MLFGRELRLGRWDRRAVQPGGGGEISGEITACPREAAVTCMAGLGAEQSWQRLHCMDRLFSADSPELLGLLLEVRRSYRHH